mmetsp:Transcript_1787/g.3169  ORF Transcript_1787/g.3169 Transcript_1787/m.3169 type:complete len:86 (-) Transcript_1787:892-1149(-)
MVGCKASVNVFHRQNHSKEEVGTVDLENASNRLAASLHWDESELSPVSSVTVWFCDVNHEVVVLAVLGKVGAIRGPPSRSVVVVQ